MRKALTAATCEQSAEAGSGFEPEVVKARLLVRATKACELAKEAARFLRTMAMTDIRAFGNISGLEDRAESTDGSRPRRNLVIFQGFLNVDDASAVGYERHGPNRCGPDASLSLWTGCGKWTTCWIMNEGR
jgi:hypothetical protein